MYFFSFLAAGGVFLLLSFTIFLPVIILSPSKFALSFTLGCLLVMAAFSALRGWKQYVAHMMSAERMPFSAGTHCHSVRQRGMIDVTHEHAQIRGIEVEQGTGCTQLLTSDGASYDCLLCSVPWQHFGNVVCGADHAQLLALTGLFRPAGEAKGGTSSAALLLADAQVLCGRTLMIIALYLCIPGCRLLHCCTT